MVIQMRHPNELGGLPFIFSTLYFVAGSFASVYLYLNHYEEGDGTKLSDVTLQAVLGSLYSIWLVSAVAFVLIIKREYLRTFYDFDTASTFNRKYFLNLRDE